MRLLPESHPDPKLLVGNETSDDAGVYQLTEDLAIVQSIDYFTPIVDDPYYFGQIAAANALSDLYAMGAAPKTVLNLVGYPIKKLGADMLAQILQGAHDKVTEAGAATIGGHSIDDQEPKFGLSVTGIIHPEKIWKNVGAKPGDVLVLTKPIGVGIVTTGIKRNAVSKEQEQEVTELMATLNKKAAEILSNFEPHAVTDVTGFGLMGHASEMAQGSRVSLEISYQKVPILNGTRNLAEQGVIPGGTKSNHKWLQAIVSYDPNLTEVDQLILCDAVTSGGLLIALPEKQAVQYIQQFNQQSAFQAGIIGLVKEKNTECYIHVVE
ncbi:selenophosphate synthase [Bacillus oleivorans]|uniref:Selenide, water dikinase n=1 Tax=Bacillus oleivorans TaxID=1448271 RepID=A0A285D6T0_9BACI|nr:selenophosphate synthase [Bacillus oleivorans]